eukprot:5692748-Heterocapsa_arctica.AAC.1
MGLCPVEPVLANVGEIQAVELVDTTHHVPKDALVASFDLWWADETASCVVLGRPAVRLVVFRSELVVA